MRGSFQHFQFSAVLFICLFFFSGCTGLIPRLTEKPQDQYRPPEAKAIISMLKNQNHALKTFKGLGRITFLGKEEKEMTTRIAWIASTPDKMRVALNSVSGQPMVSAACDGRWFYFISHTDGDFYKKRATHSNIKRFFSIPIESEDIVNILAGRIPVEDYDSATLIGENAKKGLPVPTHDVSVLSSSNRVTEGVEKTYVLVLKNRTGNVREQIYLSGNKKDVQKIEMFDDADTLLYRVEYNRMQNIQAYRVPSQLKILNDDGAGFRLHLDQYWVDVMVSSSVFTLAPPE